MQAIFLHRSPEGFCVFDSLPNFENSLDLSHLYSLIQNDILDLMSIS